MQSLLGLAVVVLCLQVAEFSEHECVIELECEECVPENMPAVTSHEARDGAVRLPRGASLRLACGAGGFLAYPARAELAVACEGGRYRVTHDRTLRTLLDLGCQDDMFEDVLHPVEDCAPPLQGRAYLAREAGGARHLATVCYDAERALAVRLRASNAALPLPPHGDARSPLSLFGNFNEMFDSRTRRTAERLYADEARLTRRLRELVRHEGVSLAGQGLAAAPLLAPAYFAARDARVARFPSNAAAVWRSVAAGNLRHVHADVSALLRRRAGVDVFAGTHSEARLGAAPLRLLGGRFPVPRYVWTAVVTRARDAGAALVLLNDPLVAVSEVRAAVFCESVCGSLPWLTELARGGNYERPLLGLVFCCSLPDFADTVTEMPRLFNSSIRLLV